MRRVNFDYGNTCPKIDAAISRAKNEIASFIDDLLSDACGLLTNQQRKEMSEQYAETLYASLEAVFEDTRRTNEDMRDAADSQISDLKDEVASLEARIEQLELEGVA